MAKIGEKLSEVGDKAKKSATRIPKKAAEGVANQANKAKKGLKDGTKKTATGIKNTAHNLNEVRKHPLKSAGRGAVRGIRGAASNTMNFAKEIVQKQRELRAVVQAATRAFSFIVAHIVPLAICTAVVLLLSTAIINIISIGQSATPSPHYYCDIDASPAEKRSVTYQQYCTTRNLVWGVHNVNGHYLVQDGSGPAESCAITNLLIRFYSTETRNMSFGTTNIYSYLWGPDGQYYMKGNTLGKDDTAAVNSKTRNLRNMLNNYSSNINDQLAELSNGSNKFAQEHGVNLTKSNWGYLRDDKIDVKSYKNTTDYYVDTKDNEQWVWDLSLADGDPGSAWRDPDDTWNIMFRVNGINFAVEQMTCPFGDKGYTILKERIDDVLGSSSGDWEEYYKGKAGVLFQYEISGNGETKTHTILLTKHVGSPGSYQWYGIDSSLGICGGWEGPLNDSSERFVQNGIQLNSLLNSTSPERTWGGYTYKVKRIGYCVKPELSAFDTETNP